MRRIADVPGRLTWQGRVQKRGAPASAALLVHERFRNGFAAFGKRSASGRSPRCSADR